jgi:hypothetical protein
VFAALGRLARRGLIFVGYPGRGGTELALQMLPKGSLRWSDLNEEKWYAVAGTEPWQDGSRADEIMAKVRRPFFIGLYSSERPHSRRKHASASAPGGPLDDIAANENPYWRTLMNRLLIFPCTPIETFVDNFRCGNFTTVDPVVEYGDVRLITPKNTTRPSAHLSASSRSQKGAGRVTLKVRRQMSKRNDMGWEQLHDFMAVLDDMNRAVAVNPPATLDFVPGKNKATRGVTVFWSYNGKPLCRLTWTPTRQSVGLEQPSPTGLWQALLEVTHRHHLEYDVYDDGEETPESPGLAAMRQRLRGGK